MSALRSCGSRSIANAPAPASPARRTQRAEGPLTRWTGPAFLLALVLALAGVDRARAEASVSASADSNFVVRGVSFSDGHPMAAVNLAYDHPGGFYAGVSAMTTESFRKDAVMRGVMENMGYSAKLSAEVNVDVGVSRADYVINTHEKYRTGYTELYAGVSQRGYSAYLYYAPRYLGEGPKSLYLDLAKSIRPTRRLRLTAHLGLLAPLGSWGPDANVRKRADLRASAAYELENAELRLAWTTSSHYYYDLPSVSHRSDAVVFGASYYF